MSCTREPLETIELFNHAVEVGGNTSIKRKIIGYMISYQRQSNFEWLMQLPVMLIRTIVKTKDSK